MRVMRAAAAAALLCAGLAACSSAGAAGGSRTTLLNTSRFVPLAIVFRWVQPLESMSPVKVTLSG